MTYKTNITVLAGVFAALVLTLLISPAFLLTSCTKTLDGDKKPNQKPIVSFVNIPPEGAQFSRNPKIYWIGRDQDGVITYFRYHVATEEMMGIEGPGQDDLMQYITSVSDQDWEYLDIDPTGPDPQTSQVIEMSASLESPVKTFLNQYVFLQGVDDKGLASDIVVRRFSRNDNPPDTKPLPLKKGSRANPAINGVTKGGIITGVPIRVTAEDPIDYPEADSRPPFEYQWRLYGPYTDAERQQIRDDYVRPVCVTVDAEVFHVGEEITRVEVSYDTTGQIDTTRYTVICDPNADVSDTTTDWPSIRPFVEFDTMLMVDEFPDSLVRFGAISYSGNDTAWNPSCGEGAANYKCEVKQNPDLWLGDTLSETWVVSRLDTLKDTIYNVFWDYPSDTTLQLDFIFWIRSRDDAGVADLVPPFEDMSVINPRYERDIAVVDLLPRGRLRPPFYLNNDTFNIRAYWKDLIDSWDASHPEFDIEFDTTTVAEDWYQGSSPDYINAGALAAGAPIAELLKHKALILYDDNMSQPGQTKLATVFEAIDAGINVWATWRVPVGASADNLEDLNIPLIDTTFYDYFAVERSAFRGWYKMAFHMINFAEEKPRGFYQDFTEGLPVFGGEGGWPHLPIDSAQLHQRYYWGRNDAYWASVDFANPTDSVGVKFNPALPEVDWSQVRRGGQTLYKYKSLYGPNHPLGFRHSFHGSPVAVRYPTSLFRTAYFNFTPLAIDDDSMKVVADSILTWLYDPDLGTAGGGVQENRYPHAPVKISIDQARENARWRQPGLEEAYRIQQQAGHMKR